MARHARHALALVARVAAADGGVGVGVADHPVPIARQAGFQLGFQPFDLHFADLQAVERVGRVVGLAVFLAQLVDGHEAGQAAVCRQPFHAQLNLLATLGLERRAIRVHAAQGLEGLGVGRVGRPVATLVGDADALGPRLVVHCSGGAARVIGLGLVMAQARRGGPVAPAQLILQVQTQLLLRNVGLRDEVGAGRRGEVAVHRVVRVDVGRQGGPVRCSGAVALHVQARQQGVFDRAGAHMAFQLRVDQQHLAAVFLPGRIAREGQVVGVEHRARRPARGGVGAKAGVQRAVVHVGHGAAQVLAHRPVGVQAVAEQVADAAVARVVLVPAGFADEGVGGNAAVGAGQPRALPREEADQRAALVALVQRLQGERGVGAGPPGQRWRQHHAVVRHVVYLRVAVAAHGHQAVEPLAVAVQRAGQVGGQLFALVTAQLQLYFSAGFRLRALAGQVQDATHAALAVQH